MRWRRTEAVDLFQVLKWPTDYLTISIYECWGYCFTNPKIGLDDIVLIWIVSNIIKGQMTDDFAVLIYSGKTTFMCANDGHVANEPAATLELTRDLHVTADIYISFLVAKPHRSQA